MSEETKTKSTRRKKRVFKVTPLQKHVSNCVHEMIIVRDNQLIYEKWLFRKADYPCGTCKTTRNVVFMRTAPLNVVIRSCKACGVTEAVYPRNPDTGIPQAHPLEVKVISASEAREVLLRNKVNKKFLDPLLRKILKTTPEKTLSQDELEELEGIELE